MEEVPDIEPPLHDHCRCAILPMEAIIPGSTTKDGENGADYWLTHYGQLPDYCISDEDLRVLGWKNGKTPKRYALGKKYWSGIYLNDDGHLSSAPRRIWKDLPIFYFPAFWEGNSMHRCMSAYLICSAFAAKNSLGLPVALCVKTLYSSCSRHGRKDQTYIETSAHFLRSEFTQSGF